MKADDAELCIADLRRHAVVELGGGVGRAAEQRREAPLLAQEPKRRADADLRRDLEKPTTLDRTGGADVQRPRDVTCAQAVNP